MLQSLHVRNIALIDEIEIQFHQGMHVLSGETGAGKSIIIDAVNFALGQRVPKDVVREDAEYALCELIFTIDTKEQEEMLARLDLPNDNGEIVLQRKITNGRSVCRVNGESVSAAALREMSSVLIDIHGQHEHQSLLYRAKHRAILDAYCGEELSIYTEQLASEYAKYQELKKQLLAAGETGANREREIELAEFELQEIEAAKLTVGEDEQLESDYRKMSNARKIASAVSTVHLSTGYDSQEGAGSGIGRAIIELRSVADYDEELDGLLSQLTDLDNLLNDFNRSIAVYEKGLCFEEQEFVDCEERLNLLNRLKNKYGGSLEKALAYREELEERLTHLRDYETFLADLTKMVADQKEACLILARRISEIRCREAAHLADELQKGLIDLNFLEARFEIAVEPSEEELSANGFDHVEYRISTNPGEKVKPLIHVASGGELSRIMLALKAVLSDKDQVPTLIFDEIDTGISGRTAQKVSEKLAYLSAGHQVICVTHLPQIAAMADVHYEIRKSVVNGRTVTDVETLDRESSIRELARMLSGSEVTKSVLTSADEMKQLADETKERIKEERK